MQKGHPLLTQRDKEILLFINVFGKTYYEVLGQTFFNNEKVARNRINKLVKEKTIGYLSTGLMSPRRVLILGSNAKEYLDKELGIDVKRPKLTNTTINHGILEQIVYYHLSQIGEVERTTVAEHRKVLKHIPDMIYTNKKGTRIYVEVETTKKSNPRYKNLMHKIKKEKLDYLLYILPTKQRAENMMTALPDWHKLRFIDIDTLVAEIKERGAFTALKQDIPEPKEEPRQEVPIAVQETPIVKEEKAAPQQIVNTSEDDELHAPNLFEKLFNLIFK